MHAPKQKKKKQDIIKDSQDEKDVVSAPTKKPTQCRFVAESLVKKNEGGSSAGGGSSQTSLPSKLKSGLENISGYDLSLVRVHFNSPKPEQLGALAYAQGRDIHLGAGQERHLPHEGWHVVQQMQGRVKPTLQMKDKTNVNDDESLEKEADVMGNRATHAKKLLEVKIDTKPRMLSQSHSVQKQSSKSVVQRASRKVSGVYFGKTRVYYDDGVNVNSVGGVAKNTILEVDVAHPRANVQTNHGTKTNLFQISRLSVNKVILNNGINKAIVQDNLFISESRVRATQDDEETTVDTLNNISAANGDISYGELEFRLGYDASTLQGMTLAQGQALAGVGAGIVAGQQEGSCGTTSGIIAEWHGAAADNWATTAQLHAGALNQGQFDILLGQIRNAPAGTNLRIEAGCHSFTVEVMRNNEAVISQSYIGAFGLAASLEGAAPNIYGSPIPTKRLNRRVKKNKIRQEIRRIVNNASRGAIQQRTDIDSPGALLSTPLSANIQLNQYPRSTPAVLRAAFIVKLNHAVDKPIWDLFFPHNVVVAYV